MANKRKVAHIRQSYCYLAISLLIGCSGDANKNLKFDTVKYLQQEVIKLNIVNNKVEM